MSGIGYDDLVTAALADAAMVLLYAAHRRELSLRTCNRLEGDLVHA